MTMKLWEPKRKCPHAVPTHLQNHVVWSRVFKCSVKPYVTWPSTQCYFNEFLFTHVLTHDKVESTTMSVWSDILSRFCVIRPTSKRWFLRTVQVTIKHDPFDPCRNPRRLYIHCAFTYCVGPSSVVWSSELGPASPSTKPMRVLQV